MSNRKNAHRRRLRVAVLAVVCGAVFAAFFARLAWMQFARADYYADKAAEAALTCCAWSLLAMLRLRPSTR